MLKRNILAAGVLAGFMAIAINIPHSYASANQSKHLVLSDLELSEENHAQESKRADFLLNSNPQELRERLKSGGLNMQNIPQHSLPNVKINTAKMAESWTLFLNQGEETKTKMKVFISFSMPEESLKKLFHQAHLIGKDKVHFSLIGMLGKNHNDMKSTILKIRSISEKFNVEIQIDPDGFERYEVRQVPAIVVYRDNPKEEARCVAENDEERLKELQSFIGVYGDVSLEFALEHLSKTEPAWKKEVDAMLEKVAPRLSSYEVKAS